MMVRTLLTAALLSCSLAAPAAAASADDLRCLDDQLDESQRAAIGALFAEQTDDPTDERELASGSAAASGDFAIAIGGCADRFNWNDRQRHLAEQYLIALGSVSQIHVAQGDNWGLAMNRYAPFGLRLLPKDGDPTEHQRAMIAAGAHANGVPQQADDEAEDSPIIEYLQRTARLDITKQAFHSTL